MCSVSVGAYNIRLRRGRDGVQIAWGGGGGGSLWRRTGVEDDIEGDEFKTLTGDEAEVKFTNLNLNSNFILQLVMALVG